MFYNIATFILLFLPRAWNFSFMPEKFQFHGHGAEIAFGWLFFIARSRNPVPANDRIFLC
jgi:hypothetical protein